MAIDRAWPHAGIIAAPKGEIITFHPAESALMAFDREGTLVRISSADVAEAHGITAVDEDGSTYLWLADASMKMSPNAGYEAPESAAGSRVLKATAEGGTVMELSPPPLEAYEKGKYRPTCVAVNETRFGGEGDIWVADGYGESHVHHYSGKGKYLGTLSGEEGAGRFSGPHALFIDRRRDEPELYVADRRNSRIQVYDLEGTFRREFGRGLLVSPTWFVTDGARMIVVEFRPPRLTVLDEDDRLLAYLCENEEAPSRPGWPNELGPLGMPVRPSALEPGKLNSPHTIAIDQDGALYVTEWLIGGRLTKLRKTSL